MREDDPLTAFLLKLERYRDNYSQEKVHIHMDKPYYAIGDTIWFKSYVVNSGRNQLSGLSKILYVELINEKDSIKKSLRLPVVAGLAWGDFILSDSLSEGNYRIRAYTNWMRNFDEAWFFDKTFKIGNSLSNQVVSDVDYQFSKTGIREHVDATITYRNLDGKPLKGKEVNYDVQLDYRNILKGKGVTDSAGKLQLKFTNSQPFVLKSGKINTSIKVDSQKLVKKIFPVKATSADVKVQFFPESGNLVNGLRTRVAFKAQKADGLGAKVSGYVINSSSEKVAEFSSEYAGMGKFALTPLKDSRYTAVVRMEDGSEKKFDLPAAVDAGVVLTVNALDQETISLRLVSTQVHQPGDELILIGQSNGIVHYVSRNKMDKNVLSASLSKKRFPSGVVQFTVFNSSFHPLAERLVFIRRESALKLDVNTDKRSYQAREKVKLSLAAIDSAGKMTQGAFSIAVTNESLVPFDDVNETTILSNLLLSSELKGHIETPNYYFTSVDSKKEQELDNLMLTQGWRKFEWKDIRNQNFQSLIYEPERTISVSGKVLNLNGTPAAGGMVTLMSSRGTGLVLDTLTDAQGRFRFDSLSFNDSTTFIIQARNAKDKKNVEIVVDRVPPQLVTKNPNAANAEVNINQSLLPYLITRGEQFAEMRKQGMLRRSIVLAEVKVTETKPKVKNSSNLNGAGNADAVIVAADLQSCQSLAFCLQGRVAGLIIQNGIAYLTRSMYSSFSGPVPMQLIVDGMYVEPSYLSIIPPTDVESIEVLKNIGNTAIYGMRGGGGVLIITTKRGERNLSPRSFAPGITSFSPQGFYISRQFYSPDYGTPQSRILPDLRTTIYWAPAILTGKDGKAAVEFYTSDKPGTYKAVIEGLDLNGSVTREVYRFNVE